MNNLQELLIVSISPYFLEKDNLWFERNTNKILEARKSQSFFEDNILYLEKKQSYNLSQLLRKLDEMGYEKVFKVLEPGEFAQRGGIIDVFPINPVLILTEEFPTGKKENTENNDGVKLNCAVRLEFLGNKIENIEKLPVEIADEEKNKEILKNKLKSQKLFSDLKGLKPGDCLVHLDHGVGKFIGLVSQKSISHLRNGCQLNKNYYLIEYSQNDRLYVPVGLERKLSRYIGFVEPKISKLGSVVWQKTKKKIKEETAKLAGELLGIAAKREIATRPPYLPDDEIDYEFVDAFQYQETPDQTQVVEEIKKDLEKEEPMDRIVCGDVGFGKTEVALRAMVKAVKSGYQAAMICPTTILANQHFHNFKKRFKNLPIKIAMLSRLQSKKRPARRRPGIESDYQEGQKEIIEKLKNGGIDIVLGTHRVLSNDVEFKNLGLLIIDDEQMFGVKQKEKLKKLRSSLDVLSLSATPIPRTLYLALSSLKNISLIQTAPPDRLPVKTFISFWNEKIIKKAIENELKRKGQVYYLHNRVETIETVRKFLEKLAPKAKFGIAHGRLKESELVGVINDFQNKDIDVLIATTIIENGLDFPNVNTLIVTDVTRLGLAQAYQIRGRVGRSHIKAFAYFLYGSRLSKKAKMRLAALKEAEELGSGYRLALKDLEIRGAGNILGKEQSGKINQVGLNLYCQILSEAILRQTQDGSKSLKKDGEPVEPLKN